jgi:hypothetical protein
MKIFNYSLMIMISAFFIMVQPLFPQDEFMEIESDEFKKHTRSLVVFPHMMHEDCIDCIDCHHDYDKSGELVWTDGGYCSDCHTKTSGDNPICLMDAFHIQCKQCHAKEAKQNYNKNIPQMCGQCHIKKESYNKGK